MMPLTEDSPCSQHFPRSTRARKRVVGIAVGDIVLCQYDAYPIWPAVIQKADEGHLSGKYRAVLPTTDNQVVLAYHCYFPDDDSSAWIRADLIVKFHPAFLPFIQVSQCSTFHVPQSLALQHATRQYQDFTLINSTTATTICTAKHDPLSQENNGDRLTLVRMLGQWFLQSRNSLSLHASLQCVPQFTYESALKDRRKLPHVLRINLAPATLWPRNVLPPVRIPEGLHSTHMVESHESIMKNSGYAHTRQACAHIPRPPAISQQVSHTGLGPQRSGGGTITTAVEEMATSCIRRKRSKRQRTRSEGGAVTKKRRGSGETKYDVDEASNCTMMSESKFNSRQKEIYENSLFEQATTKFTVHRKNATKLIVRREICMNNSSGVASHTMGFMKSENENEEGDDDDDGDEECQSSKRSKGRVSWGAMRTLETCQFRPVGHAKQNVPNLT